MLYQQILCFCSKCLQLTISLSAGYLTLAKCVSITGLLTPHIFSRCLYFKVIPYGKYSEATRKQLSGMNRPLEIKCNTAVLKPLALPTCQGPCKNQWQPYICLRDAVSEWVDAHVRNIKRLLRWKDTYPWKMNPPLSCLQGVRITSDSKIVAQTHTHTHRCTCQFHL